MIDLGWQAADRHAVDPWPPAVLVVDDDAAKRLALTAVLTPLGYTVVEANSGEAALRCLLAQDFAVILLDVRMPGMDGFDTAAFIRLRKQSEMTPIIFVTAHQVDEIWVARYYKHGAVDFLFAPIQPAELRAKVSFFVDTFVKARALAEKAREVQASADQLRLLTDAAPIGIFQTDVNNNYRYTNPQWSQITGVSAEAAVGRAWGSIIVPEQRPSVMPEAHDGADPRVDVYFRCSIERPDSSLRIALINSKPIMDMDGTTAGWVGTLSDVTAQARAEDAASEAKSALESLNIELAATARRDPLTGLSNRLALTEDLELLEARVTRYGHRYSVALLDVDHFKSYNDTYGHQAGDDTLRAVAAHLHEQSRGGDAVYRYGGEEFLCVFPEQDLAAGVTAAQRMRAGVAGLAIAHAENAGGVVTVSGGVATLEPGGLSTVKEVLKDADDALYRAKQRGRNRIEPVYPVPGAARESSHGPKSSDPKMSSVGELRDAIAAGQLEVYYQPVVHLLTGAVLSAEALVRWNHPHRGVVGPADFIPVAEESGLIADLTSVVIDTVLQHTTAWATAGRPLKCAVNLSAKLLSNATQSAPLLAKLAANADAISVEVTESALADDATLGALRELADCGVEIALDDFGTGYSSLARLKDMPVMVLKIDRTFVHNLDHDERDVAIIEMIAHLAEALGLDVIAEGIETENTAGLLRASGISQAQGYLYARPMPLSEFDDWVSRAPAAVSHIGKLASTPHRAEAIPAESDPVDAEDVDVTQVLLDSTRTLLRVASSEQAVDALMRAVADLGGTYIPSALTPATSIPIDISLGHADALLLTAPDSSQVHTTIEHVLPALAKDARVAAEASIRHARA